MQHNWLTTTWHGLKAGRLTGVMLAGCCAFFTTRPALANEQAVSPAEARAWVDHVIPLPKQIEIRRKITLRPQDVSLKLRPGAGAVERQAYHELEQSFASQCGGAPTGRTMQILLGVADNHDRTNTDVARLQALPNQEQAYLITSTPEGQLRVTALHEKGVYYGVRTLIQLLRPKISPDQIEIPLLEVLDWPDFEERGVWNCRMLIIDQLAAALKLNFSLAAANITPVQRNQPATVSLATNEFAAAHLRGVHHLPALTHLNFIGANRGVFAAYPELRGQGDGAKAGAYHAHRAPNRPESENRAPCASQPVLVALLTDWLTGVAAAGVPECGCWLTERPAQCGCEACRNIGQFVLEARACVQAWQKVRKQYPAFTIRLFISTTTDEKYDQVLRELPADIKVERACALGLERRRHEPRDIFRNDLLDAFAAQGRWVATYDAPITANGKVDTPEFKVPESSAHRMRDFVRQLAARKYRGIYGMPGMAHIWEVCGFNIAALAEWSWNLNGRTEKDFARAWALREGYTHPDRFAEWSELMGPVEWDVYASGYPEFYAWGEAVRLIESRTKPVLGHGPFRYYADTAAFESKLEICRQALTLAKNFNHPHPANETCVVMSYIQMARAIYRIAELMSSAGPSNPSTAAELKKTVAELEQAGADNVQAIKTWRMAVAPEPWHPRVHKAIAGTESTVAGIRQIAASRSAP